MKTIYAYMASAVLFCSVIATFFLVKSNSQSSSLMRSNIEALAQIEDIHPDGYVECWIVHDYNYDPMLYIEVRECVDCKMKKVSSASKNSQPCML